MTFKETIDASQVHDESNETSSSDENEEYEPMFGFGMFDEPSPDTTEILEREVYDKNETSTTPNGISTQRINKIPH